MVLLCETFLNNYLYICFVGIDSGCVFGVILRNNTYKRSHATTFDCMLAPITTYDPNITVFEGSHRADKKKWSSKLNNQIII